MTMVTWGPNTVHTIGTPAPGAAAPTPASTSAFSFGAPSPAPATGSLFGPSTPAPAPAGTLFGSTTPAPATGGFFGSPAPAPATGSLFGSFPAPAPGGSLFGFAPSAPAAQPQQQQQAPQIAAYAAMQAHRDVTARNEQDRVLGRMQKIYEAYTGAPTGVAPSEKSHCFSTVLYNPLTPQERQMQAAYSSMAVVGSNQGAQLMTPPKPPQISQADWYRACIRNPDAQNYMPVAVVGAESLQARAVLQQEQADTIAKQIEHIQQTAEALQKRQVAVKGKVESLKQKHRQQLSRLLKVMRYVEVARCFNLPQQSAEWEAQQRMINLKRQVGQLVPVIARLSDPQLLADSTATAFVDNNDSQEHPKIPPEEQKQLKQILTEHRTVLTDLTGTVQKDLRDLELIRDRVLATETISGRPPAEV